jgi:hypothetical protein
VLPEGGFKTGIPESGEIARVLFVPMVECIVHQGDGRQENVGFVSQNFRVGDKIRLLTLAS